MKRLVRLTNYYKYPLLASGIIQISSLVLFTSQHVQKILPEGNNLILDWIYQNSNTLTVSHYLLAILCSVGFLFNKRNLAWKLGLAVFFMVLVFLDSAWATPWIYPFLLLINSMGIKGRTEYTTNNQLKTNQKLFSLHAVEYLGLAVLLAGFFMMTIEIPFPHETAQHTIYMLSLSTVLLLFALLFYLVFHGFIYVLIGRLIRPQPTILPDLFTPLIFTLFFVLAYLYAAIVFQPFILQFDLNQLPLVSAGILTNLLFIYFGSVDQRASFKEQLFFFLPPLIQRNFWIKFLIFFFSIRELYIWLIRADQNFLVVFIYDLANVIIPITIFWLSLSVVFQFFKKNGPKPVGKAIIWTLFIAFLIPAVIYCDEDWTFRIEYNRPAAKSVSFASRTILNSLGINTIRASDENINLLEELIEKANQNDSLSHSTVFYKNQLSRIPNNKPYRPHIFLILADAVYAQHLSVYGYQKSTSPNLEKFKHEAILFRHFYSSSSATAQAVTALFKGRYIGNRPHRLRQPARTLCDTLTEGGYELLLSKMIQFSWIEKTSDCFKKEFISYKGEADSDWQLVESKLKQIPQKPLFVYFHLLGGHDPWTADKVQKKFRDDDIDIYNGLLFKADSEFGKFINNIKSLGIYENSVIIFTSDHGIGLGRHLDKVSYSNLYNVNIQIPFLIKIPGIPPKEVDEPYSQVDIRSSLEELIAQPSSDLQHGQSFLQALTDQQQISQKCVFAIAAYSDVFSMQCASGNKIIYDRGLHYLEIFNSFDDPYELESLSKGFNGERFQRLSQPLIRFMSYGETTFARR